MLHKYFKLFNIYKITCILIRRAYTTRREQFVGLVPDNYCLKYNEFTLGSHICPITKDTPLLLPKLLWKFEVYVLPRISSLSGANIQYFKISSPEGLCVFPTPDGAASPHLFKERKGCSNLCHRGCQPSPPHRCTARAWHSCHASTQGKEHTDYKVHPASQVDT